ncbi:hypothetical protein [Marinifilum flexuosum]|uniref:Uncharacterized protein n=1 Tax=Marinifilum flexuosum TaxID=1117708 RepID=A0A419WSY2_9BACT|nr:hypothetical protein [Marinifilum flexuosum]RKD98542.1 hypothetical protein BXY64_3401 [Marinifilum flexuosum]
MVFQLVDVSMQLYFKEDCHFESIEDVKLPNEPAFTDIIENELSFTKFGDFNGSTHGGFSHTCGNCLKEIWG